MTTQGDSDLPERIRTVLDAASEHVFGTDPGRLAAELYDVLVRATDNADRARVAAELARCWSYGGRSDRAAQFSDEALARAELAGDPALLVECLDAVLACHWGPDDLPLRRATAARLDEVAAHVLDPEARLQARLWGLQVAVESLEVHGIRRHLRALDRLAEESPRARFFAASRRWMYDMLVGRTDRADELIAEAQAASEGADLPDAWMVLASMRGYTAVRIGDHALATEMARDMETFARDEGITSIAAAGASVWAQIGDHDRARSLLGEIGTRTLQELPRDYDYLPILCCTLDAALDVDEVEVVRAASALLAPYEGRAVVDAGAVYVYGVTDDVLARAAAMLGDHEEAQRLRNRAVATYRRIGATWWHERLSAWQPPTASAVRFHPDGTGLWLIGTGDGTVVRALRGLDYLHRLLSRPGESLAAIDLVTQGTGTVLQPDTGPLIDRAAAAAYRGRLADLDAELAEADEWADISRAEALQTERDALLAELRSATGLGGRARATGATKERARIAVTKAIASALTRIQTVDPDIAEHLRACVHTGAECTYRPLAGAAITWRLSASVDQ